MYKLENKHTRLQIERKAGYKRTEIYKYEPKQWNLFNDVEDNSFKPLVDKIIELNESFFITGQAGTGKSHLIRQLKEQLKQNGKSFQCIAPTNLAALNINGITVHKFVSKLKNMKSLYQMNLDYLFLDEVSMLQEIFYKFLISLQRITNVKFIIAGDFRQLPPVKDRIGDDFDYSNSQALLELSDFNKVELSKCRRADGFIVDLENIYCINKHDLN